MKKIKLILCTLLCAAAAAGSAVEPYVFPTPPRQPGQKNVLGLRAEPIRNIRVAFIGTGNRGGNALKRFSNFPDNVTIKVACDLYQEKLDRIKKMLAAKKYPYKVDYYTGRDDWKKICERDDIDLVYVTTGAGLHTPIAVHAMKHGKHVAVEVPAARNIAECWQLVDTAEQTRKHCMILENCNFDDYALAVLNMKQKGLFGEPVHVEGGYFHDMRDYRFNYADKTNWRQNAGSDKPVRSANPYPTHGIGPVAHWLGIHRGDKMETLNSVSSADFALRDTAAVKFGKDDPLTRRFFPSDINLSVIRTNRGKTILIYYTTSLPGPYSRGYKLYGTRGFTQAYPEMCFAFDPKSHTLLEKREAEKLIAQYRHPIFTQFTDLARKMGGHGGMDTVMDMRLIYCLNNGLPLDIDVYDAAEWSSLIEASRKSMQLNGAPVAIPDFTRGDWDKVKQVSYQILKPGPNVVELKPKGLDRAPESVVSPVGDKYVRLTDPRGDDSIGAPVDFVGGSLRIRDGNLDLCYTAAAPIERAKLSYHVKALITVGSEGGYDNEGTRYLVENGALYRFAGTKPFQWKWEKIAPVQVRLQQQFCEMSVPLKLICPEPDRISVRFRCQDDYMPDQNLAAPVLTPGNHARNPKTKVETSPSRKKYSPKALNDGQISPEIFWADAAWASQETEDDKFITFKLPKAEQLKRILIYWEKPSAELLVQYPEGNGWKTVAVVKPAGTDQVSSVKPGAELPKTDRIRFLQKLGKGHPERSNLLWIREIEIY